MEAALGALEGSLKSGDLKAFTRLVKEGAGRYCGNPRFRSMALKGAEKALETGALERSARILTEVLDLWTRGPLKKEEQAELMRTVSVLDRVMSELLFSPGGAWRSRTWVVKRGDVLERIARRFRKAEGNRVTPGFIEAVNRITAKQLRPGQKLRIPLGRLHVVVEAEDDRTMRTARLAGGRVVTAPGADGAFPPEEALRAAGATHLLALHDGVMLTPGTVREMLNVCLLGERPVVAPFSNDGCPGQRMIIERGVSLRELDPFMSRSVSERGERVRALEECGGFCLLADLERVLKASGDVGKLVDHLGLWIREATSEDTILHRQAFIDAAWEKTAAESAHLASVAEVARAIQNYPTDSENFSHPDAVAAKLVAVGKVRPGTTAPQLVREAKRYLERGLADAKEESLGFLGKILPPRVARWLVSFLNKILSFLNVGIPLDKLEIFGRDAELGLLESFLAVDFGINVIARILWPLLVGLGICPQVIVVIGGCLLFGGIVGNLLKNNARDRVWVKVVVLAVCIVVFHDVLSGGHGLTSMVARPVGAAFEKWVEINPLISKPPTPTPFPTPFGPTPTPAILPEGWEI